MARPARFDEDTILRAALQIVHQRGPNGLTIDAVAEQMGGHVGSIYYRFPTKDHLLARLWIRSARAGQIGVLAALRLDDLEQAFRCAALHYPRWSREEPAHAQMLAAYGREQLIRQVPDDLAHELDRLNGDLGAAVNAFAKRWYGELKPAYRRAATFALLDLPASAIRRYLLAGRPPPSSLDPVILAASRSALTAARIGGSHTTSGADPARR